ncbi:hypothetical protein LEP1GSC163_2051 [Leptospira santarosai str. CBC379]|nr:hypothetical protein LEP1GSC163_2051 [Leptospira santarosai str. CBC379]
MKNVCWSIPISRVHLKKREFGLRNFLNTLPYVKANCGSSHIRDKL